MDEYVEVRLRCLEIAGGDADKAREMYEFAVTPANRPDARDTDLGRAVTSQAITLTKIRSLAMRRLGAEQAVGPGEVLAILDSHIAKGGQ